MSCVTQAIFLDPLAGKRPWSSGSNGVSVLKFDGYEWVFEQQSYSLGFKAWVKKEGSTVVNFEFNETK